MVITRMDRSRQEDFIGKYYRLVSIRNTCIKDVIAVHKEKIGLPRQILGGTSDNTSNGYPFSTMVCNLPVIYPIQNIGIENSYFKFDN